MIGPIEDASGPLQELMVAFVYDSFMRSVHDNIRGPKSLKEVVLDSYRRHFDHLVDQTPLLIASVDDEPSVFEGWILGECTEQATVVYWGYVKRDFRRRGLFRRLVHSLGGGDKPVVWAMQITGLEPRVMQAITGGDHVHLPMVDRCISEDKSDRGRSSQT